jgi:hypothetical protein
MSKELTYTLGWIAALGLGAWALYMLNEKNIRADMGKAMGAAGPKKALPTGVNRGNLPNFVTGVNMSGAGLGFDLESELAAALFD